MPNDGITELTFDLDFDYDWFTKANNLTAGVVRDRLAELPNKKDTLIRRSASGRTHIKVLLSQPVTLFESFLIRAYVGDDPYRIVCDLSRYFHYRDDSAYMRLFDEKYTKGQHKTAGDWLDWGLGKAREMVDKGLTQ